MSYNKWESYTTWNYKKINNCRYSAGILPYTFDQDAKCYFLLGKDYENDWSDFGGRCELKDKSEPINTATREFFEETLGAVLTVQECINKINIKPNKIISKTLNGSPYYMYLIYVDYQNYLESFNKTSNFLKYHYNNDKRLINKVIEKNLIRWVSMDTILNCLENGQTGSPISLRGVFHNTMFNAREQLQFLIK